MFVIELMDPLGKDSGLVGTRDVETGGPFNIGLISFWTFGKSDFIVFNAAFQCFNLSVKPNGFAVVGFLGLVNSADSSTQYSPESGGIKVGDIPKKGVQGAEGDGDWRES